MPTRDWNAFTSRTLPSTYSERAILDARGHRPTRHVLSLCFFREHELRRPLKIGIREDIIAQHPELQPSVIVSALQNYTRCVPYWSTLKAGAARIDLDGNVAGQVTLEDEQAANVKIAKAERRAKAREIEDRQKTPAQSLPRQPPSRRR